MTTRPFALLPLLASLAVACGDPCLPTFQADTLLIAPPDICWLTTDAETSGDSSDSSGSGDSSATGEVCSVADPCEVQDMCTDGACVPIPPVVACPNVEGAMWATCDPTGGCVEGSSCLFGDGGWICVPACDDANACGLNQCDPGAGIPICVPDAHVCAFECVDSADCATGQMCGLVEGFSVCLWPVK
jgi:hypothetical protein